MVILVILGSITLIAGVTLFVIMGDNLVLPLLGSALILIGVILLSILTIRFLRSKKR